MSPATKTKPAAAKPERAAPSAAERAVAEQIDSQRLRFEVEEQLLERMATDEILEPAELAILVNRFGEREVLAERRRAYRKLALLKQCGDKPDFEKAKRRQAAADKAAEKRLPEIDQQIAALERERDTITAERDSATKDIEARLTARKTLVEVLPKYLTARGSPYWIADYELRQTVKADMDQAENRLRVIEGALRTSDKEMVRHCDGRRDEPGVPQVHEETNRDTIRRWINPAELAAYRQRLRSEGETLPARIAALRTELARERHRIETATLGLPDFGPDFASVE